MRGVVVFLIGTIGAVAIAVGSSAFADSLKSVVRTLNAIVNPGMLGRLEDQARLYHRANEERYWLNYGAQLIPSSSLRRPGNGDLGIVSRLDTEESQLTSSLTAGTSPTTSRRSTSWCLPTRPPSTRARVPNTQLS